MDKAFSNDIASTAYIPSANGLFEPFTHLPNSDTGLLSTVYVCVQFMWLKSPIFFL